MKFWKRNTKQQIEFFNIEPSVCDNYPIIESKDLKLKWIKNVRESFNNHVNTGETNKLNYMHLSRCPGIFDLFKYGYIIPLAKDIIIKPFNDGKGFECIISSKGQWPALEVTAQTGQGFDLLVKPPWAADFIIKIDTGWHVIAPKGIKFLILPIAYPDTFDFTSTIGIFDPALSTPVNFQMYWNATEPETLIRAGTPLGHYIPLTEKKYEWVQRVMNQQDRYWVEKLQSSHESTFWQYSLRKKIADMYNKYWKR